jgi:hypothetical protein
MNASGHVVLLGDSIFDNGVYVPGGPSVIENLQGALPPGWRATLLAVDGAVVESVSRQLERLPDDATHLVVSVGGNDALGFGSFVLHQRAGSVAEVLSRLAEVRAGFERQYRQMLSSVLARNKPTAVCTIYDAIPGLGPAETAGLCLFNDVILREAFAAGLSVIDLRLVCQEASDYAAISPIEPSAAGGGKIARAVASLLMSASFQGPFSQVVAIP